MSSYELINALGQLKEEKDFLKEVPSQSLQQAILNMDSAYKAFFKRHNGFPKFKKKGTNDSFRIPSPCKIDYNKWIAKIAKLGDVKIYKGHNKEIEGTIKSYTIASQVQPQEIESVAKVGISQIQERQEE